MDATPPDKSSPLKLYRKNKFMYSLASQPKQRRVQVMVWLVLVTILVGAGGWVAYYWRDYQKRSLIFDPVIAAAAQRNGIDPLLVKAVIWQESRFNKEARGAAGEIGLMQVIPGESGAVRDWAIAHRQKLPCKGVVFLPEMNIEIGSWYLARALYRWRDYKDALALALCEYNAGITKAKAWRPADVDGDMLERIGYPSTRAYVAAITANITSCKLKERKDRMMVRHLLQVLLIIYAAVSCAFGACGGDEYRIEFNETEKRYGVDFPQGWEERGFRWGVPNTKFYVTKKGTEEYLVVDADNATGAIMFDVYRFVDLSKTPIMRWRWRVHSLPPGADGRVPDKDDQALAVYVGFGNLIRKSVAYRWETETPLGATGNVVYSGGLVQVAWQCVNNKATPTGQWVTLERNVAEDLKKIYGEVPKAFIVSVGGNSQYTKSHTIGEIDYIEFLPQRH